MSGELPSKSPQRCFDIVDALIDALAKFGDEADIEMLVALQALTRAIARRLSAGSAPPLIAVFRRRKPEGGN